ncbi:3-deoxy-7-phosphoheptulonate synthase [Leptolyngbya cf. ectocarpi LEGE 11479]|uniref:3-deoxy-7-phosphoheptulonate synthase n=1 Tax=Leptolyngbya cf. ectocarpi LEGE 11479 TaxID=1828722 RepID=A0A928ZSV0_LEPEC|nr:3-deoxy-7-phosphoheptulonate synthase [Leptolyngbya ectocarpi]MBE9065831.1 3-deoxy-7-phosphoheptulonate synthase [Leptolyngbya cf. ectocarpi LEGE 11479]
MKDAKLVAKAHVDHTSEIEIAPHITVGGSDLLIVGGPCSIESMAQMETIAQALHTAPVQALRGGIYKPRTSPYSFQGLGDIGLDILSAIRKRYGLPIITEVMTIQQIEKLASHADVLQVGSRNMQNFDLLKALGDVNKPILLKRGLAATVTEFVMAAEYIASHGNSNIILCERGIRSFDNYTRNVLDLGAVVALKQITHLPVLVDPSHATGKRELVAPLARAAIAAGADGLMIECHPDPDQSVSDARQTISLEAMAELVQNLIPVAQAVGRSVSQPASQVAQHRPIATPQATPH